jgi:LysM repeat protein
MIQGANPYLKPRALRVGQRLIIPMSGRIVPRSAWSAPVDPTPRRTASAGGTVSHRVRSGETASRISRHYGVGLRALLDYNGLDMDSIIKPGQTLRIPSR